MWDRACIPRVFLSHMPLTPPVRMHLDPNMHVTEDVQWHQRAIARVLVSIAVLLPPILCGLHAELQPDHVYQQRPGNPGPNKGMCVCRLCRRNEEDRKKKRIKARTS